MKSSRTKSMSLSSSAPIAFDAGGSPLNKSSSMADLRGVFLKGRWLKRLKSKTDFDFGCAGEHTEEYGEEDDILSPEDFTSPASAPATCSASPLPLPQAPQGDYFSFPDMGGAEAARAEARRLEEARAVEAMLAYMANPHSTPYSSSPSKSPIHEGSRGDDDLTVLLPYLRPDGPEKRSRSSTNSSFASSSNRDSLVSYNTSEPSSPAQTYRRPSLTPTPGSSNLSTATVSPDGPQTAVRHYSFF